MLAKKCDRCGKLYEEYGKSDVPNGMTLIHHNAVTYVRNYNELAVFDLCEDCMEALNMWMDGEA